MKPPRRSLATLVFTVIAVLGIPDAEATAQEDTAIALEVVQSELDSLALKRHNLERVLEAIAAQMDSLERFLEAERKTEQLRSGRTFLVCDARLYGEPSALSKTVRYLSKGMEVVVLAEKGEMLHVSTGDTTGYLPARYLGSITDVEKVERIIEDYRRGVQERRREDAMATELRIGMDDETVRKLLGRPRSVNRTTTSYGVSEQWVYPGGYVYFDNGRVSAWQESR